jgi:circadian clock protein KaiB
MKKKKTDQIEVFEKAAGQDEGAHYLFRLYITGTTPRSMHAVQNLKKICLDYLDGRYEIEVIDVCQEPGTARENEIVAIPTLVKELPPPLKKFIGDLSNLKQILEALAIKPKG